MPFGFFSSLFLNIGGVAWLSRRRSLAAGRTADRRAQARIHCALSTDRPDPHRPSVSLAPKRVGALAAAGWLHAQARPVHSAGGEQRPDRSAITDQVIAMVVTELERLLVNRPLDMHIAINLCRRRMSAPRAPSPVIDVTRSIEIHRYPDVTRSGLEVTERGFIDIEAARTMLTRAPANSATRWRSTISAPVIRGCPTDGLPLDALKIDKSFIDTIGMDSGDQFGHFAHHRYGQDLEAHHCCRRHRNRTRLTISSSMASNTARAAVCTARLPAKEFPRPIIRRRRRCLCCPWRACEHDFIGGSPAVRRECRILSRQCRKRRLCLVERVIRGMSRSTGNVRLGKITA